MAKMNGAQVITKALEKVFKARGFTKMDNHWVKDDLDFGLGYSYKEVTVSGHGKVLRFNTDVVTTNDVSSNRRAKGKASKLLLMILDESGDVDDHEDV